MVSRTTRCKGPQVPVSLRTFPIARELGGVGGMIDGMKITLFDVLDTRRSEASTVVLELLAPVVPVLLFDPMLAPVVLEFVPFVFPPEVVFVVGPVAALVLPTADVLLLLPVVAAAPPRVLPPLVEVLAPVLAEELFAAEVVLPVLLVLPPVIVPLVLPPAIVPVVVFVEFWFACCLSFWSIADAEVFEADDVPL